MFGLTEKETAALEERFGAMVRGLIQEKNPDGFAVATAVAVVHGTRFLGLLPQLVTALGAAVSSLQASVDDLIGEIQDMRGVPTESEDK